MRINPRLFCIAAVLLSSSVASAQAWVNPKGDLFTTLRTDYQTSDGVWHGSRS